ncbi:thiol reductant ABC exporter subunit CydD [Pseudoruegeria sp. HB172150]|uniref:thiol reductant ABC exporter subunit CydD n=1 Tax=Pseudoruegeria sp. HB172150 TaxID=2721164 RepID=UPI00155458C9|nr:thiol reductant ABC exporter subunit CydD [Pseudoruegeria sp. HB172150]
MPDPQEPSTDPDRARLRRALGRERRAIGIGAALSAAAALVWPLQALCIAGVFAGLLTGNGITPGLAAVLFVALAGLRAGLTWLAEGVLFRASQNVIAAERAAILRREAQGAAESSFGGPGAVAALAAEKLEALHPYITRYAPAQARVAVVPPLILILAFWQSWAVGIVLLMAGPLIPVFMALVGWAAKAASEKQMAEIGHLSDLLVDRLAALPDVRVLDAGALVTSRFAEAAEALRARTMAVLRIAFLSSTVLELFAALGVAMVAVWVGFSLLGLLSWGAWGGAILPFAGIFLLLLAPDFFQPLRDLAAAWHDRAGALAVAGELAAWEAEAPAEILGTGGAGEPLPGAATVRAEGLTARRGDRLIAYPDFTVAPGEKLALSGPSGAGKTTLLRVLAGLERAEAGRVEVCGAALNDGTADGWRARLGWMPQQVAFLARSLRYNVGFGAALRPEVVEAAALDGVIATLPQGDRTVLGETGAGLSGGEARRVMLARALEARPDVLLADEPTADLDFETADRVTEGLLELAARGCTLIVATHDPRLIARMDRVVAVS